MLLQVSLNFSLNRDDDHVQQGGRVFCLSAFKHFKVKLNAFPVLLSLVCTFACLSTGSQKL